jgi:hypothetical protein
MFAERNNINLIIENQYFGCIEYYFSLYKFSNIKIEQFETWQKMSFRNRCVILGANGLINLTIPLENGRDQKRLIRDVKINNLDTWQKQHWRSIFSSYGKSPFFEYYRDFLETFYAKKYVYLFDMNLDLLFWLQQKLKIEGKIELTASFQKSYAQDYADYRNKWLPNNFQSGPFSVKYQQVFEEKWGFQPNLSILDYMFNAGPDLKSAL